MPIKKRWNYIVMSLRDAGYDLRELLIYEAKDNPKDNHVKWAIRWVGMR
jgi:hypothetical protein